jgi:hypothetical protein
MRAGATAVRDLAAGAAAGALATWAMGKVTGYLYQHEDARARRREDSARRGRISYEVAAERLAGLVGRRLRRRQRARIGVGIHWGLGIAAGAAYGALRRRLPGRSRAAGLAFGAAFWLAVDETLTSALALTPGPGAFPWQTHARGLAGHLAYGLVADAALGVLCRRD